MEIRHLDRGALNKKNDFSQRLMPWRELNAPFGGAWCVINPGTSSTRHSHLDYEIFIAISGEAVLELNEEFTPFRTGDIAHFPPNTPHHVVNNGTEPFELYAVWWDSSTAEQFLSRHNRGSQAVEQEPRM